MEDLGVFGGVVNRAGHIDHSHRLQLCLATWPWKASNRFNAISYVLHLDATSPPNLS